MFYNETTQFLFLYSKTKDKMKKIHILKEIQKKICVKMFGIQIEINAFFIQISHEEKCRIMTKQKKKSMKISCITDLI